MPDGTPLFITTGTPSDCVGLALLGVVPERPDLVVSGINQGVNLGHDVTYSGTLAAAMEAAVFGLAGYRRSQDELRPTPGRPGFRRRRGCRAGPAVLAHGPAAQLSC